MALIKFGNGISAIRGKIAGNVYSRNKSGNYIRNWNKPTNQPTPLQTAVRAMFAIVSGAWNSLSQAQRDAWNTAAQGVSFLNRLGDSIQFSGQQLFQKVNNGLSTIGVALLSAVPSDFLFPDPPLPLTAEADVSAQTITLTSTEATVPANTTYKVGIAVGNSGKSNFKNQYRLLGYIAAGGTWDTEDISSALGGVPGFTITDSIYLYCEAVSILNGMSSERVIIKCAVVP